MIDMNASEWWFDRLDRR